MVAACSLVMHVWLLWLFEFSWSCFVDVVFGVGFSCVWLGLGVCAWVWFVCFGFGVFVIACSWRVADLVVGVVVWYLSRVLVLWFGVVYVVLLVCLLALAFGCCCLLNDFVCRFWIGVLG